MLDLTRRYDGARRDTLEVSREEWERGVAAVDSTTLQALGEAAARIHRFARAQRQSLKPFRLREDGIVLEQRLLPVARVGVYAPGGRHPLCSSVLMGAIPARVAGCREVVLATPPRPDGTVHPAVLAAARIAAVDRVFAMGGAQAIAALAFGTGSVPAVDIIVGPGNRFVTEAKAQLSGQVGIDLIAGPSELAVIADGSADPDLIAADLRRPGGARPGYSPVAVHRRGARSGHPGAAAPSARLGRPARALAQPSGGARRGRLA